VKTQQIIKGALNGQN